MHGRHPLLTERHACMPRSRQLRPSAQHFPLSTKSGCRCDYDMPVHASRMRSVERDLQMPARAARVQSFRALVQRLMGYVHSLGWPHPLTAHAVVCSHESTTATYYHALTTMCAPIGDADVPLDPRGACLEVSFISSRPWARGMQVY